MPYYLHEHDQDPRDGYEHPTKRFAIVQRQLIHEPNRYTISLVATEEEQRAWKSREHDRFVACTYAQVPWTEMNWSWDYFQEHYAHMSLAFPGQIAYTPDDNYGIEDRQLRVTPGKYLHQFAPNLPQQEIDEYCGEVRAFSRPLQIARTPDDVFAAYCSGDKTRHGQYSPTSCMSYQPGYYKGHIHPVCVYGDSDLGVAYLGTLGEHITSRCVVWPEKKIFTVVYGDLALRVVLKANGYQQGTLNGAKIRRIFVEEYEELLGYIIPFIDGAATCVVSQGNSGWLTLSDKNLGIVSTDCLTGVSVDPDEDDDQDPDDYDEDEP